jgi:hypothetical protein
MPLSHVGWLRVAACSLFSALLCTVIQADSFVYSNFSSTAGLNLVASATQIGNEVRLSAAVPNTVGSLWNTTKRSVENGFETMFTFRVTGMSGNLDFTGQPGGDGLAFLVQNTSSGAFGVAGSYMGYEVANSIAVELDTWQNPNFLALEPSNNHVGVQSNGTGMNGPGAGQFLGAAAVTPNMSDGAVHTGMVRYVPNSLTVFIDNMVTPVLTVPVNLSTLLSLDSGKAFVGFTGGGASAYENHDLLSWKFASIPEPSSLAIAALAAIAIALRRRTYRIPSCGGQN